MWRQRRFWIISAWSFLLAATGACLLLFAETGIVAPSFPVPPASTAAQTPGAPTFPAESSPWDAVLPPPGRYTPDELVNIGVYEKTNRAVVNIRTRGVREGAFPLLDVITEGEGSGAVIDRQGHIVTNHHVIEDAKVISVTLFDGTSYEARLVGVDPPSDIAVLQIDAPSDKLNPVAFGDSTDLKVGQRVFAIGNPFGLERTLTTGIISSLNRTLPNPRSGRSLKQMIQIDAAINPGNSGGPLIDSRGMMIGMNTAIASKTGESVGVGFAIPVNNVRRVVQQLIRNGRVVRADAGIVQVLQTEQGLLIAVLRPGGAAERAGLQGFRVVRTRRRQGPLVFESTSIDRSAADLIVAVDGSPIRSVDDLLTVLDAKQPGDRAVFTVIRAGKQIDVPVILDAEE